MCRNVHVARPSCSTSTGHSAWSPSEAEAWEASVAPAAAVATAAPDFDVEPDWAEDLDAAARFPGLVQVRQSEQTLHGFPSGPLYQIRKNSPNPRRCHEHTKTIPGGSFSVGFVMSAIPSRRRIGE